MDYRSGKNKMRAGPRLMQGQGEVLSTCYRRDRNVFTTVIIMNTKKERTDTNRCLLTHRQLSRSTAVLYTVIKEKSLLLIFMQNTVLNIVIEPDSRKNRSQRSANYCQWAKASQPAPISVPRVKKEVRQIVLNLSHTQKIPKLEQQVLCPVVNTQPPLRCRISCSVTQRGEMTPGIHLQKQQTLTCCAQLFHRPSKDVLREHWIVVIDVENFNAEL